MLQNYNFSINPQEHKRKIFDFQQASAEHVIPAFLPMSSLRRLAGEHGIYGQKACRILALMSRLYYSFLFLEKRKLNFAQAERRVELARTMLRQSKISEAKNQGQNHRPSARSPKRLYFFLSFPLDRKGPILRKPNAEASSLVLC